MLDAAVIVTRWFGGTKLGTAGLARAYGQAAWQALSAAPARSVTRVALLEVAFGFERLGAVEAVLARAGETVLSVQRAFDPEPRLTITVPISRADDLTAAVISGTSGHAAVRAMGYSKR